MRIETAIRIVIVLLVIIVTALVAALFIIKNEGEPHGTETAPQTTTEPSTTEPDKTTPSGTTDPEVTSPEATTPEVTTPTGTTTPEITTTPDESTTDEGDKIAPDDFSLKKTFSTDTGTFLNLKAVLTANEEGGKVRVKVELFLDHYSLFMGARNGCKLSFGDVNETFSVDKFELEENIHYITPLHVIEGTFEYGETYDLYAFYRANCLYGDVEVGNLVIEESVTLE